jgi:glycosyltransferase involved in cell wall biosynthesis
MRITVVTPSYNQAEFLEDTLRSVLDQHYPDLEYIVMDGGSTDGSTDILERYASSFAHLQSGRDGGQTDALIQGFRRATGDILAWLNSDDTYEPGTLAEVADYFARHPDVNFIYGDALWVDRAGRKLRRKREIPFSRFIWLRTYNYIPQPSAFWRRSLYEAAGGLDPTFSLAMDSDLFARFAERTRPVHVRRTWSHMRVHPDQRNVVLRGKSDAEDLLIRRRYVSSTGARLALERAAARTARVAARVLSGGYLP